jgi:cell wall-associated NlpC family hydrolase
MSDVPIPAPPSTQPPWIEELVTFVRSQIGKGYSEEDPVHSFDDGHLWFPGDSLPDVYDCSGLVCTTLRQFGFRAISNGSAEDQWVQSLGGRVHTNIALQPGDIGSFLGSTNRPGYAGHTGIVLSYNHAARTGMLGNAYNTERGVCEIPFNRDQVHNLGNGLGVLGFYRPANRRR